MLNLSLVYPWTSPLDVKVTNNELRKMDFHMRTESEALECCPENALPFLNVHGAVNRALVIALQPRNTVLRNEIHE